MSKVIELLNVYGGWWKKAEATKALIAQRTKTLQAELKGFEVEMSKLDTEIRTACGHTTGEGVHPYKGETHQVYVATATEAANQEGLIARLLEAGVTQDSINVALSTPWQRLCALADEVGVDTTKYQPKVGKVWRLRKNSNK